MEWRLCRGRPAVPRLWDQAMSPDEAEYYETLYEKERIEIDRAQIITPFTD